MKESHPHLRIWETVALRSVPEEPDYSIGNKGREYSAVGETGEVSAVRAGGGHCSDVVGRMVDIIPGNLTGVLSPAIDADLSVHVMTAPVHGPVRALCAAVAGMCVGEVVETYLSISKIIQRYPRDHRPSYATATRVATTAGADRGTWSRRGHAREDVGGEIEKVVAHCQVWEIQPEPVCSLGRRCKAEVGGSEVVKDPGIADHIRLTARHGKPLRVGVVVRIVLEEPERQPASALVIRNLITTEPTVDPVIGAISGKIVVRIDIAECLPAIP